MPKWRTDEYSEPYGPAVPASDYDRFCIWMRAVDGAPREDSLLFLDLSGPQKAMFYRLYCKYHGLKPSFYEEQ